MYDIHARVIQVWDDKQTVILSAGHREEVREGDLFVIYAEGENVTDPDTGEDYGPLEWVKARVYVEHVMPHTCKARTRPHRVSAAEAILGARVAEMYGPTREQQTRFEVHSSQTTHHEAPNMAVVPGDMARRWSEAE